MTGELFKLRPVQEKALEQLRSSLRAGKRRPQLQLPTGAGKTIIAAHAVAGALAKNNRVAFAVPLLSLIDQTVDRFVENGIALDKIGVMQADHPLKRPDAPVQICSVQTLAKRTFPSVEFVLVDESHLQYSTIYEWMDEDPKRIFIGLSATPWAEGMGNHYDDLLIPATIKDLIAAGDLCKFKAYAPGKPDLSKIKVTAGEYQIDQIADLMGQKSIVADVVSTWLSKAENRPTMLFAVDRAHAAKLHDEFCSIGVRSAYVDAYTDRAERDAVKSLFHRGEIKVVCSVGTMIAGVDWDVRCISFCRPTKSPILLVQALGRGLRNAPGKDHLLILDHSSALLSLGLPTEIHFDKMRGGQHGGGALKEAAKKKLPSPRECPKCGTIVPATERNCECGHTFKYVSKVVTQEGELEEVGAEAGSKAQRNANDHWKTHDKAAFHAQLKFYGQSHGYATGWAANKYKARFGVWPNDPRVRNVAPAPPSTSTLIWIRGQTISNAIAWKARKHASA